MKVEKVGFDIGSVILDRGGLSVVDYEWKEGINLPEIDGASDGIRWFMEKYGRENVYIISKCSERAEGLLFAWLIAHSLLGGSEDLIPFDNVNFCRKRSDKAVFAKALKLDAFVDDRPEVLSHMVDDKSVRHRFAFDPDHEEMEQFSATMEDVIEVEDWEELTTIFGRQEFPQM